MGVERPPTASTPTASTPTFRDFVRGAWPKAVAEPDAWSWVDSVYRVSDASVGKCHTHGSILPCYWCLRGP